MPRPPLPLGAWGRISLDQVAPGVWRAMCRFRDYDGVTRKVEARAETGAKAERELIARLQDRKTTSTADVHGGMRVSALAGIWWDEFNDLDRAARTRDRYREALDTYILPSLGNLQVRECTVSALDRFLKAVRANTGAPTAKLCKTVLSGVLGVAMRHGALEGNPLRDVAAIPANKTEVRALTVTEVVALRAGLDQWQSAELGSRQSRPQDLLDLVDVRLATGVRIGEALALRRQDIGFDWASPHTFRKSVGTVLANTQGLAAAQRQLGHSSDKVTSAHYVERAKVASDMTGVLEAFGGAS